ncbi:MAG: transglutaminase domain-containing protein [Sedimentisphaerales bacterium]|nr:transglutaminase domain-containing protein [Sedimentisphaerales bacterium]
MKALKILLVILLCGSYGFAAESETEYGAVFADGAKIGYMVHQRLATASEVRTTETMHMSIARGGMELKISVDSTSIETPKGKPLGFEYVMNAAIVQQKITGRIGPDGILTVTTEVMGTSQTQTMPWPEGALMSEGLRLLELEKDMKEGSSFTAIVFEPSMVAALEATVKVGPKKQVDLLGRVVELTEAEVIMKAPTGQMTVITYLDKEMNALKTVMEMLGMKLELIACDKEFALSPNDVVDFLDKMLVSSPQTLGNLQGKTAEYTLIAKENSTDVQFPTTDNQMVQRTVGGRFLVRVKPVTPSKGTKFPYRGKDPKLLEALEPTSYLQCDQKEVRDLAGRAVGATTDAAEAVKKIEAFVDQYVTGKDLSVGYATALEVATSKQGDCTEHAVLTAALCRAVGIPARIVFGLVYVDEFLGHRNVFGGHAWTEAYVGGKWVGLDATRSSEGFGAGHITLGVGNGDPKDFFSMINTLGYFTIEKVDLK